MASRMVDGRSVGRSAINDGGGMRENGRMWVVSGTQAKSGEAGLSND